MIGTHLLRSLGTVLPIVQAPMAGVSTPELAAAVTNAGGLGSLGLGAMIVEQAARAIVQTRRLTTGPFNVNVFCHTEPVLDAAREGAWLKHLSSHFAHFGSKTPERLELLYTAFEQNEAMFEMLLDLKPAIVSFHFGLPSQRKISALRSVRIRMFATATNVHEAGEIEAAGLDAIVAQGFEAGGHRGVFDPSQRDEGLPTLALTRALVRASKLPVIAAGGIMDGAGIAAVRTLGAEAAQMGTAFLDCPESNADANYREALRQGGHTGTTMTRAISGRPARGLVNRFTALAEECEPALIPDYPLAYSVGKALHSAALCQESSAYAAHWAGQGVAMLRSLTAALLVKRLGEEMLEANVLSNSLRSTGSQDGGQGTPRGS